MTGTRFGPGRPQAVLATIGGIVGIAGIDFATGLEIRVYPLYFLPIAFAAARFGTPGGILSAVASCVAWASSNAAIEAMRWDGSVWFFNTMAQAIAFLSIGIFTAKLREAGRRLEALSRTDALTGLPNSRAFHELAEREVAICRRLGRPVLLAYLDLDKFKQVNDTHGHKGGDEVLKEFAAILRESVRSTDLCARIGGDEFVLLVPDAGPNTRSLLEEIRELAATRLRRGAIDVTASIGAVLCETAPEDLRSLIEAADKAMYRVKAAGRNSLSMSRFEDVVAEAAS